MVPARPTVTIRWRWTRQSDPRVCYDNGAKGDRMFSHDDLVYYRVRALEERLRAAQFSHQGAAAAHAVLADRYAVIAENLRRVRAAPRMRSTTALATLCLVACSPLQIGRAPPP